MSMILDEIKLNPSEYFGIKSSKVRQLLKIIKLSQQLDIEKEATYQSLNDAEKKEAFHILQSTYSLPEFLTVSEAAELLEVTPQMVRRYCSEGKVAAHQRFEGSGKWKVDTDQFIGHPSWDKFVQKRLRLKEQSLKIAEEMVAYLDDDEN